MCVWITPEGMGLLLMPACDTDHNSFWHPFFSPSLLSSHSPHPSIPWDFLSCFGSWILLTLSLPFSPYHVLHLLPLHWQSNVFTNLWGLTGRKREAERERVCIFMRVVHVVFACQSRNKQGGLCMRVYVCSLGVRKNAVPPYFRKEMPKY